MDLFKNGMKGPARPAPPAPGFNVNRYSPVTNWNDDPFGADVFEPNPQYAQKKIPPPRPPPPRMNKQPDVPVKPSHFLRKPTVLTSLLSRKSKNNVPPVTTQSTKIPVFPTDFSSGTDSNKMFQKCEPKNVHTGTLIDFSSPPSSPTFTTRSSSDGLSVDSFGSDATSSTNHHNAMNGGSTSQAESGFEDDFDLFLNSRKIVNKDDTFDDFSTIDPFSPQTKPNVSKKAVFKKDFYEITSKSNSRSQLGPTIIRAKPARPKPPDNTSLLKSTFGNTIPVTLMSVNTTTPIQKVSSFGDSFDEKQMSWDRDSDRESSPPMPSIPPPPPPAIDTIEDLNGGWADDLTDAADYDYHNRSEPYAVALFDYHTDHAEDLNFSAGDKITLLRRENAEWLYGKLKSGREGIFPSNYVEIKQPLPNEDFTSTPCLGKAVALYDFEPVEAGDLRFSTGDTVTVTHKLNSEWYYGICNGLKGQFPINYVQMNI